MKPRTFHLERDEDVTGVSGTGRVAEGVIFSDGAVALHWIVGPYRSIIGYPAGTGAVGAGADTRAPRRNTDHLP